MIPMIRICKFRFLCFSHFLWVQSNRVCFIVGCAKNDTASLHSRPGDERIVNVSYLSIGHHRFGFCKFVISVNGKAVIYEQWNGNDRIIFIFFSLKNFKPDGQCSRRLSISV